MSPERREVAIESEPTGDAPGRQGARPRSSLEAEWPDGGPEAVLFDLDGTLIATRRLYIESFVRALEPHVGRRLDEGEIMARRPRAEVRFLGEWVDDARHERCLEDFYDCYDRLHPHLFQGVYRGVPDLLDGLRIRGVPVGLVTGKSRRAWEITRRHAPLGSFSAMVFDDDVPRSKPDPSGLELALDRLDTPPDRAVYVGDSLSDLDAARAAGVRPAGVLWSKRAHEVDDFARAAQERGAVLLPSPESVAPRLGLARSREAARHRKSPFKD